jgi:small subunit ribosomal protein S2
MNITMQQMLESGLHFGHQTRFWHPKMANYIFGVRHRIHIVNLDKTLPLLKSAINFVSSLAAKKGKILFVGTKPAAQDIIRAEAERCGMPYVSYRWPGGMLTNYKTLRQSIKRLKELEELRDSPISDKLTKKEALMLDREIERLDKSLGGVRHMGGLPDAMFVIDVGHERIAINEARKLKIPIIGVVDTNCSPDGIDYVIPGNDDAVKAIKFYAQHLADAIALARSNLSEEELAEEKEGKAAVHPHHHAHAHKEGGKARGKVVTKRPLHAKGEEDLDEELMADEKGDKAQHKAAVNTAAAGKKTVVAPHHRAKSGHHNSSGKKHTDRKPEHGAHKEYTEHKEKKVVKITHHHAHGHDAAKAKE